MTKKEIDYSKGLIYKLCCKDPTITDVYIGSTTSLPSANVNIKRAVQIKIVPSLIVMYISLFGKMEVGITGI